GPFAMASVLYYHQSYRTGFASLAIPALIALIVLFLTKRTFSHPEHLETKVSFNPKGLSRKYWIYLFGVGFVSLGFVNFALVAYHLNKHQILSPAAIPLLYAMANAISGGSSLGMGKIYDRKGVSFLALITALVAPFSLLVFLSSPFLAILGMILFGIGTATQSSLLRAVIAHLVPASHRGSAYGLLNLTLGLGGAIGSYAMGSFYDVSIIALIAFSIATQCIGAFLFLYLTQSKDS
ncbi:MAG: MFS transporter, partial [Chlamydiae bacterium]|nr:MFS transporter [Chlamydiota bacterium]